MAALNSGLGQQDTQLGQLELGTTENPVVTIVGDAIPGDLVYNDALIGADDVVGRANVTTWNVAAPILEGTATANSNTSVSASGLVTRYAIATADSKTTISAAATLNHVISPSGFSDETEGTPNLTATIHAFGFSDENEGTPNLTATIYPASFTDEAFGTPNIIYIVKPDSFTDEISGTPTLTNTIHVEGFQEETFGTPQLTSAVNILTQPAGIMSGEFFGHPVVYKKTKEGLLVIGDDHNNLVGTYAAMGPKRQFIKLSLQHGRNLKEDFKQSKNVKVYLNKIEKNEKKRPALSLTLLESRRHGKIYDLEEQGRTV